MSWDARNQLASMSGGSLAASFAYDALGRRRNKTIDSTQTRSHYDGLTPVQELDGSGTVIANLLTGAGIDEYLARTDAGGTRTQLTDILGSTVAELDATVTTQAEYTYEPFGQTALSGPSGNAFRYTGREDDGTGLYYYRARFYDPERQRFVSEDPIGFGGGSPNLYEYGLNDPILFTDPTGHIIPAIAAGGLIGGLVVGGVGGFVGALASNQDLVAGTLVGAAVGGVSGVSGSIVLIGGSAAVGNALVQRASGSAFGEINLSGVLAAGLTGGMGQWANKGMGRLLDGGGLAPFWQGLASNSAAGIPFIPVSMLGDLTAGGMPFTPTAMANAIGGWAGRKPLAGPPVCVLCALSPNSPWYTGPFGAR